MQHDYFMKNSYLLWVPQ